MKPGWQTTEFWLAAVAQVVPALVLSGVIKPGDASTVAGQSTNLITGVGAAAAAAGVLWQYIQSRTQLKAAVVAATASPAVTAANPGP